MKPDVTSPSKENDSFSPSRRFFTRLSSAHSCLAMALLVSSCASISSPVFYAGVGAGVSKLDLDPGTTNLTVADGDGTAAQLFVGADVGTRVGIEGFYADLGEAVLSNQEPVAYSAFGANALLYFLPGTTGPADSDSAAVSRRNGISLFGRFGIASIDTESEVNTTKRNPVNLTTGLGIQYGFRNGIGLRFDITSHDTDALHVQLGMMYRFPTAGSKRPKDSDQKSQDTLNGHEPDGHEPDAHENESKAKVAEEDLEISPLPTVPESQASESTQSEFAEPVESTPSNTPEVPEPTTASTTDFKKDQATRQVETDLTNASASTTDERAGTGVDNQANRQTKDGEVAAPADLPTVVVMTTAEMEQNDSTELVADADADGVEDSVDACRGSSPRVPVDAKGCTLIEGFIDGIKFEPESAVLTVEAKSTLADLADELTRQETSRYSVLTIPASTGDLDLATFLAKRRTLAVIRYLIARGIAGSRLRAAVLEDSEQFVDNRDMSRSWVVFKSLSK